MGPICKPPYILFQQRTRLAEPAHRQKDERTMLSLRRAIVQQGKTAIRGGTSLHLLRHDSDAGKEIILPTPPQYRMASLRFLDIYKLGNKEALAKERARITDEMNRGYFADISEMKKHGGKIAMANKIIIPAAVAAKFPALEVNFSDGRSYKLPNCAENSEIRTTNMAIPLASLLCVSFRASSQAMIESWSVPFLDAFTDPKTVLIYEVSLIDSWFLSLSPIKKLLLWTMRKSPTDGRQHVPQRQIVYSFGDHYYFRKELKILNLLTGYVFLLDRFGRIRWQGSGFATQEELSSLISCTSQLQDK